MQVALNGSQLAQSNSSLLDCATPELVIMEANLGNVDQVSLGKGNTSKLFLINCGLRKISQTTFSGFKKLETLQLNENKVDIQEDAFKGQTRLTFLSFDKCKMRDLEQNWFAPLKNLTRLSLTKNEIIDLSEKVFFHLTQLEELYLHFNLLKAITQNSFSNLRKLKKLNLSLNIIHYIAEGTFQDLTSLRYSLINLSYFLPVHTHPLTPPLIR